jgi:kexin
MQHLCVNTAVHINPNDPDWEKTASGRLFSYKYGYGRLDGYAFVTAARDWKLVKPQAWLEMPAVQVNNGSMNLLNEMSGGDKITHEGTTSKMSVTKDMLLGANLETLEHISVKVWIQHKKRGDVEIELVSPNGVRSILAGTRSRDSATTGFPGWRFSTIKHW